MSASGIRRKPDHYLLSRSLSPEFVTRDDIIEFKLDGTPVSDTRPGLSGALHPRRDLRGAAGRQRRHPFPRRGHPAVQHLEDADVLRRPCGERHGHPRSGLGHRRQVRRRDQSPGHQHGRRAATWRAKLGKNSVVLMRGHGFAAAADGLLKLVRMSVYLPRNARILLAAMQMGEFKAHVRERDQDPQQLPRRLAGNAARLGVLGASAPAAATCWQDSKGGV